MKHGYGIFYNLDGSKFYRGWANDEPDGKGTFYFTDGRIYEGIFTN
jgi:hypothetical protein